MIKNKLLIFFIVFLIFIEIGCSVQIGSFRSGIIIDLGIRVIAYNFNGLTNDFLRMTDLQLGNLQNMTLEVTGKGKIVFNQIVNLSNAAENGVVDLDRYVIINQNSIYIDNAHLPTLTVPVTMSISGLNYNVPSILNNGLVCTNCQIISYISGVLVFNVTSFSGTYTVIETTNSGGGSSGGNSGGGGSGGGGGGGGGGSGGAPSTEANTYLNMAAYFNYTSDIDFMHVTLKQGNSIEKILKIYNQGNHELYFSLNTINLDDYVLFDKSVFILVPGESRDVKISIFASENAHLDVISGQIVINTAQGNQSVNFVLEIQQVNPLLDVKFDFVTDRINSGSFLVGNLDIKNIGDIKKQDVKVEYFIEDFSGNRNKFFEEVVTVEHDVYIKRILNIPKNLSAGDYYLYVKLTYGKDIATSGSKFTILNNGHFEINVKYIIIFIFTLLFIIWFPRKYHEKIYFSYLKLFKILSKINKIFLIISMPVRFFLMRIYNHYKKYLS